MAKSYFSVNKKFEVLFFILAHITKNNLAVMPEGL